MADDADATESRKKQRQQDQDFNEGLSDEEVDLVKDLDRELGDDPDDMEIPDWDSDSKSRPVSRTYVILFFFRENYLVQFFLYISQKKMKYFFL